MFGVFKFSCLYLAIYITDKSYLYEFLSLLHQKNVLISLCFSRLTEVRLEREAGSK